MFPTKISFIWVAYRTVPRGPLQPVRNQTFWFPRGKSGCLSAWHLVFL